MTEDLQKRIQDALANPQNMGELPSADSIGTVGNADTKNPPGQVTKFVTSPDNGYECDGNSGIARSNPAHTSCTGTVLYINFLSPALKGGDYTISKILAEVYPQEVQTLFPLYRDAFAGLSRAELKLVQDFRAELAPHQLKLKL